MYIIYQTKQKSGIGTLSIYFVILFFLVYLLIIESFHWHLLFFIVIDMLLFINFYQLTFRATNIGLEFGFGIFKRKINKELIDSIFIDNSFGNFIGAGIIFGRGSWGFIAKPGEGLRIKLKNQAVFFITVSKPEDVLEIIKNKKYV